MTRVFCSNRRDHGSRYSSVFGRVRFVLLIRLRRSRHFRLGRILNRGGISRGGIISCRLWRGFGQGTRLTGAQNDIALLLVGLDPAGNFAFGDAGQHFGIRGRRFGAKVSIVGCQIAEVFRDSLHRFE